MSAHLSGAGCLEEEREEHTQDTSAMRNSRTLSQNTTEFQGRERRDTSQA